MKKVVAIAMMLVPSMASAQSCESYVGQTVTLNSFNVVAAAMKKMPAVKGEYETTAQYEARIAAARGSTPETVILPGVFSPKYMTYDADAGVLKVQAYALRNINTSYGDVFGYGSPYYEKVKYSSLDNIDAVLSQKETPTGTYTASNAYGAKALVTKITRLDQAVFEGEADFRKGDLFVDQKPGVDAQLGTIAMTIPEAQAFKAGGKVAFVAKPKWPYYAEGKRTYEPKIDSPTEVNNVIQVIVADIQCGLVLSPTNKVLAAYTTR